MKRLVYFIALTMTLFVSRHGYAQEHTVLMLDELPQAYSLNPAKAPLTGGYMIVPGLAGISAGFENSGFCFNDAFRKGANDSLYFDFDRLSKKMSNYNLTTMNLDVPILGAGFTAGKNFITIDVTNKTRMNIVIPASILDIRFGNYDFDNDRFVKHSLSDIFAKAFNYFEYAVGYSRDVNDKIRVGGKTKLLLGNFALRSKDLYLSIDTRKDGLHYALDVHTRGNISLSAPLEIETDKDGYVDDAEWDSDNMKISSFKNAGFAADLGMTMKLNEQVTLGVSVLDLGFIRWKNTTNTFISNNDFSFTGVDVSGSVKDDPNTKVTSSYWTQLEDSLSQFTNVKFKNKAFTTALSANILTSVTYKPYKWFQAGGVVSGLILDKRLYTRVSASATLRARNWLGYVLSFSMDPGLALSMGQGLALTAPGFQFYVVTDRMPLNTLYARSAQVRVGFNFFIGRRKAFKKAVPTETETVAEDNSTVPTL